MRFLVAIGFMTALSGCWGSSDVGAPLPERRACTMARERLRIAAVELPHSSGDLEGVAFDLSGTENPDDALGSLFVFLDSYTDAGPAVDAALAARLTDGAIDWVLEIGICRDGYAEVRLGRGDGALAGAPRFLEDPGRPAVGQLRDGRLTAIAGQGAMPISAMFDPLAGAPVGWHVGDGAAFDLTRDGAAWSGRIGIGLAAGVERTIAPPIAAYLNDAPDADPEARQAFDYDADGVITQREVIENSIIASTAANPDLDLLRRQGDRWVYDPDTDGLKDSLSFALEIAAE